MSEILVAFIEFWYQLPNWVHTTVLIFLFVSMFPPLIHTLTSALGKGNYHTDCSHSVIEAHSTSDNNKNITIETDVIIEDLPLNCVNCGASLNGKSVCEYCGTVY